MPSGRFAFSLECKAGVLFFSFERAREMVPLQVPQSSQVLQKDLLLKNISRLQMTAKSQATSRCGL